MSCGTQPALSSVQGGRINLCGSDNTPVCSCCRAPLGSRVPCKLKWVGWEQRLDISSVCQGKVPLNCKKPCICSVFVLPPMSLWVYYTLMTSVMAEQIISEIILSLSFAPWGNPGSSRMFYGSGKRWSHCVLMNGKTNESFLWGQPATYGFTICPSLSWELWGTGQHLEPQHCVPGEQSGEEMVGEACFLSDLWIEMAGALHRKQDPQDGQKLPAQVWHPWWLALAAEAGPVL